MVFWQIAFYAAGLIGFILFASLLKKEDDDNEQ